MTLRAVALLFALSLAVPAAASEISLRFPLDCTLDETCFVQNLVDTDPGPAARDHTCGPMTYDGHKGTDIRLDSLATMRAGVDVLAAAPGRVRAIRDGMPDIASNAPGAPPVEGRECGNGIVTTHPGGWEVQYCHLQAGSIAVATDDEVAAGDPIARIGLSGNTEFPHLHIELRHDGRTVDPFNPEDGASCGTAAAQLWSPPIAYRPGGILNAGISLSVPEFEAVRDGPVMPVDLGPDAPALVLWGFAYGLRQGDELSLRLADPRDRTVAEDVFTLDRNRAEQYRAAGRRRPDAGWPTGTYTGDVALRRGGAVIDTTRVTFEVR